MWRTPSCLAISGSGVSLPLNAKDDVREITFRSPILASRFNSSSVSPSAKYSFSLSGERFANGSTAIDLSPSAGGSGFGLRRLRPWSLRAAAGRRRAASNACATATTSTSAEHAGEDEVRRLRLDERAVAGGRPCA